MIETPGQPLARLKHDLHSQLRSIRRNVVRPMHPEHQKTKVTISGKTSTKKDDLALALMMALFFSDITRQNPEFVDRCHRRGWLLS